MSLRQGSGEWELEYEGQIQKDGDLRVTLGSEAGGSELTYTCWSKGLEVRGLGSGWERDMARGTVLVKRVCALRDFCSLTHQNMPSEPSSFCPR